MEFKVDVKDRIFKPVNEVFDAIHNPDKISKYFTSSSSGPMEAGTKIIWDFSDYCTTLEVEVKKVVPNELIRFAWAATGKLLTVDIALEKTDDQQTSIHITEGPFPLTDEAVQKALQQTQGWTDFICSLKAWLYTGINLRKGEMSKLRNG